MPAHVGRFPTPEVTSRLLALALFVEPVKPSKPSIAPAHAPAPWASSPPSRKSPKIPFASARARWTGRPGEVLGMGSWRGSLAAPPPRPALHGDERGASARPAGGRRDGRGNLSQCRSIPRGGRRASTRTPGCGGDGPGYRRGIYLRLKVRKTTENKGCARSGEEKEKCPRNARFFGHF